MVLSAAAVAQPAAAEPIASADRTIDSTSVAPGETTTVTVRVQVEEDASRLSITESFSPAFASVSSPDISFEGGSGSVTITSKTDSQAVAAVSDVTAGTTVVMTYDVTGDAPGTTHSISGTVATGDRTEPVSGPGSIDVVEGDFEVSDLETPASVSVGESFSVSATVTNTGDAEATQTVELRRGGETVDSRSVTLGAGESTSVTFDGLSIDEGGTFTYRVSTTDDTAAARIEVIPENTFISAEVRDTGGNPISTADTDVRVTFINLDTGLPVGVGLTGDRNGENVSLNVRGETRRVPVPPGNYSVRVAEDVEEWESKSRRVSIESGETIEIDVTIERLQIPTEIQVTPKEDTELVGNNNSFIVTVFDQFGEPLADTPVEAEDVDDTDIEFVSVTTKNTDEDGQATFTVTSDSTVSSVPIEFTATRGDDVSTTAFKTFVRSGEGSIQGHVINDATTNPVEDASVWAVSADLYDQNKVRTTVDLSLVEDVDLETDTTIWVRLVDNETHEVIDKDEYDIRVASYSGVVDASSGTAVRKVRELNTSDKRAGSGFAVIDKNGDGQVAFTHTRLEPEDYYAQVSLDAGNVSDQRIADTGSEAFVNVTDVNADDSVDDIGTVSAEVFSPTADLTLEAAIDRSERSDVSDAIPGANLVDSPGFVNSYGEDTAGTDVNGLFKLNRLYSDFAEGRVYVAIATKAGFDTDFNDVFVTADGELTFRESVGTAEFNLEPEPVTPVVDVDNIALLPDASAVPDDMADASAYSEYAYDNQTDRFTQVVPRNGEVIDVVRLQTTAERSGASIDERVTVAVPDEMAGAGAATADNFNGSWMDVAGGTIVSQDPANTTITVATGSDGEAILWLRADRSTEDLRPVVADGTLDCVVDDDVGFFSGITAVSTRDVGARDSTCKIFSGITEFASISGIVTDENNDPIADADVWIDGFQLVQNEVEVTITRINDSHANVSIYNDAEDPTTAVSEDTTLGAQNFIVSSAIVEWGPLSDYRFQDFSSTVRQRYGLLSPSLDQGFTLYTVSGDEAGFLGKYTLPYVPSKATNNVYSVRGRSPLFGFLGNADAFTRTGVTDDANVVIPGAIPTRFLIVDGTLSAPDTAAPGDTITVSADVTNNGSVAAQSTVEFRLDLNSDGVLASDEVVASKTTAPLAAGETTTVEFDVSTAGLATGTYAHGVFTSDDSDTASIEIAEGAATFDVSDVAAPDVAKPDPLEISATVENTGDVEGTQSISFNVSGEDTATGSGALDIAIVFDTTGSMGEEISGAKSAILDFTDEIDASGVDARYALVTFKDDVTVNQDFTSDASTMKSAVDPLSAAGGSRIPEDSYDALSTTVNDLERRSSARLVVIHVTDAPSHYRGDGSDVSDLTRSEAASQLNGANAKYILAGPTAEDYFSPPDDEGNVTALAREDVTDSEFVRLASGDFGDLLTDEIASAVTEAAGGTTVTLAPGESTTVEFSVSTSDLATGDYSVSVSSEDDSGSTTTTISASGAFDPAMYDDDGDGEITTTELQDAIVDWSGDEITKSQLEQVIVAWSTSL